MLLLEKGEARYWYLTLTEKTTISNPTYLFNIHNRVTDTITNFILVDVSTHKERYNKFYINETSINADTGEYEYKVFAQTSSTNVDPNLSTELVEQGILKVNPVALLDVFYEPTLVSNDYDVPQDGIYDYLPIYYAYLKRVPYFESAICLQNTLYNLSKQI